MAVTGQNAVSDLAEGDPEVEVLGPQRRFVVCHDGAHRSLAARERVQDHDHRIGVAGGETCPTELSR